MSDLLPYNATPQERALSESAARAGDVPVLIREVWDADTCPAHMLPWLAWAFSVDEWDSRWTVEQQREFIKRSVQVHRYKGTIGAVREAMAALSFNARVQEWFAQSPAGAPFTFRVLIEAEQIGVSQAAQASLFAVVERTKNLRSHLNGIELTARSVAGPVSAGFACIGHEITVGNYTVETLTLNENVICF